jgi:hypothetical protein
MPPGLSGNTGGNHNHDGSYGGSDQQSASDTLSGRASDALSGAASDAVSEIMDRFQR